MQKQNFVSNQRDAVEMFKEAMDTLDALREQWDALSYATEITQDDLQGENADLTPVMLADALSSHAAIVTLLNQGHRTNLYRLLR